ncbi:MAG: tRNA (guanosine(46)-N7)-methyltransferase TrmB [Alphaproteobacteria bacterium]|nr:tRNA (guanosine(46)-N7)-methyltransferase TrmB [Alphaproteobacteria bacterium]
MTDKSEVAQVAQVTLRFYGRRKSHKLRQHQQELYDSLLPRLTLRLDDAGANGATRSDLAAQFAMGGHETQANGTTYRDFWLEIGFGGGEHMVGQARAHPDIGVIGCDMFLNGLAQALRHIDEAKIANIRLVEGDARHLLSLLPDQSLGRVYILFPDPWPKKRHHRRRIINQSLLDQVARVLRPGSDLRLATDDLSYLSAMLSATLRHREFNWQARRAVDWRTPPAEWVPTRYQKKAERAGRRPYFLNFTRV